LTGVERERFEATDARYRNGGAPAGLARVLASFTALRAGPDLVEIAAQTKLPIAKIAPIYFEVVSSLSLDWLRGQVEQLEVDGHWQAIAQGTLQDDIFSLQRTLCQQVLATGGPPANLLDTWRKQRRASIQYAEQAMKDIRSVQVIDFATLSVAMQAVRRVAESSATLV
jgi:glutamate dehydrogenase